MSTDLVAAIDIGSARIACLIARQDNELDNSNMPSILGVGVHQAAGIRKGEIVDMEAASESIRGAIIAAEDMAGISITHAFISVNNAFKSTDATAELALDGAEITSTHVHRLLSRITLDDANQEIIHKLAAAWQVDEQFDLDSPLGRHGENMAVLARIIHISKSPAHAIATCLRRCGIKIEAPIATPYAAGLSCLTEGDRQMGALLIDMGQDVTTVAYFKNGLPIYMNSIPIGGRHLTNDIAQCLNISLGEAERLKILQGSAYAVGDNDRSAGQFMMAQVIESRLEELFDMIKQQLKEADLLQEATRRQCVLVGGTSLLAGIVQLVEKQLVCKTRLGTPPRLHGLPSDYQTGALATAIGLVLHARLPLAWTPRQEKLLVTKQGRLSRLWQWFKENF